MQLNDYFPLSAYTSGIVSPGDPLELMLVVDGEKVFAELDISNDLTTAFEALGMVGSNFPERTLKAVARGLTRKDESKLALEAIKKVWQPDDDMAAKLDDEIPSFYREPFGRCDPLEALEYLGPRHPRLLARVATGLLPGSTKQEEDQQFCLQMFNRLQSESDSSYVVGCLVKALFHPTMERYPPNPSLHVLEAFQTAAARDYAAAVNSMVERLRPSEDAWVRCLAAATAATFAAREDERLVAAFRECSDARLIGKYLCVVATSFGKISSSANPFIASLAASLLEDWEDDTLGRLLATLKQLNPVDDEDVISTLLSFMSSRQRSPELLKAAELVDQLAQADRAQVSKAYTLLMESWAVKLSQPGSIGRGDRDKKQPRLESLLLEMAEAQGGAGMPVLGKLIDGFSSSIGPLRLRCKEILVKIKKSVDADIIKALLQVIHERMSIPSCCLAIHAIKSTASERQMEEMTPKFLELLKVEKDCFVKCALLEALRNKSLDPQVSTLGLQLTRDPVDTVRLAALELLMDQTAMDGFMAMLLRCMKDPSSLVSQLALVIVNSLPAEELDTEEMAREVSQLLLHPDAKIRLAATEALRKMGSRGKSIALSALSASGPWPELDLEVRQKRDEAIATLQAD